MNCRSFLAMCTIASAMFPSVVFESFGAMPSQVAPAGAGQESTPALVAMDHWVPADCDIYIELTSLAEMRALLEPTRLWQLLQHEELRTLIEPRLKNITEGWRWICEYSSEMEAGQRARLSTLPDQVAQLRRVTLTVLDFPKLVDEASEHLGDVVISVEWPGAAQVLFDYAHANPAGFGMLLVGEVDRGWEETTVAGLPALRMSAEEPGSSLCLIHEPGRLWLISGEHTPAKIFEDTANKIADAEWYGQYRTSLAMQQLLGMVVIPPGSGFWELMTETTDPADLEGWSEEDRKTVELTNKLANAFPEWGPKAEGVMVGWAPLGDELSTRVYLHGSEISASYSKLGQAGVNEQHLSLADADADLYFDVRIDWQDAAARFVQSRATREAIVKEYDRKLSEWSPLDAMIDTIQSTEEKIGIAVTRRLLAGLGPHASLWLDIPAGFSIPPAGIAFDLKDTAAFDALLDELLAKDAELDAIDFTVSEYKGSRVVTATLRNAGLPLLPSLARVGDQVLLAVTPQVLKSCISGREKQNTLAQSPRLESYRLESQDRLLGITTWMDLGQMLRWSYLAMAAAVSAIPGEGLGSFDPSMLPSVNTVTQYFGAGRLFGSAVEGGVLIEGRSTVGEPFSGLAFLALGAVGLFGLESAIEVGVLEEKQEISTKQLIEIALAMRTYRDSVGSGSWPESLVQLVDRGFLENAALLKDPADPNPKSIKSATGERLPVSYAVVTTEGLDEYGFATGSRTVLVTRDAWYSNWFGDARLAIDLGSETTLVLPVPKEHWSN